MTFTKINIAPHLFFSFTLNYIYSLYIMCLTSFATEWITRMILCNVRNWEWKTQTSAYSFHALCLIESVSLWMKASCTGGHLQYMHLEESAKYESL